jgi:hypothetical protein
MAKPRITAAKAIQQGDKTHNQDQLITLHNFRTTNATVNRPEMPMPLEDVLLLFLIVLQFVVYFSMISIP